MTAEQAQRLPVIAKLELVGRRSGFLSLWQPGGRRRTALDISSYDESVALGKSPAIRDIERLARKAGFRALLNLNTEGEPGEVLSPNVEASWAHTFGMQHERVSIDLGVLRPEWVDQFLKTLREIAKPVYVHSLQGRRAAALMTLHLALERRISGNEALVAAKALGIDCALDSLRRSTVSEVDRRILPRGPAKAEPSAPDPVPGSRALPDVPTTVSDEAARKAS